MKKQYNPTAEDGQARSTFVFNAHDLEITNLYLTAVFNNSGFDSARIFANWIMSAELILKYSYSFNEAEFEGMTDEDIYTEIKATTDPYLSDPTNLRVWEASEKDIDISETSSSGHYWKRSPTRDTQLICDLDHHSKASPSTNKSSGLLNTKITWDEGRTTGTMVTYLTICIIPPPRIQETYTLSASHFYMDDSGVAQEQTVNPVTLKADIYNVTKEDLEFKHVHGINYDRGDSYNDPKKGQCVLFALSYKGDKYGPARLINVSRYSGYILSETSTNMCLLHSYSNGLSAIFYYPSTHERDSLHAGEVAVAYMKAKSINADYDISASPCVTQGNHWSWIKSYTPSQVGAAHALGIPIVVSYHNQDGDNQSPIKAWYLGDMMNAEYTKIEDNCGNTIELRFYGAFDCDFNGEFIYHKTMHHTAEDGTQSTSATKDFYKWSEKFEDGSSLLKIRRAGPAY